MGMQNLCDHVSVEEIEWRTERRQTILPYGLLVRTYKDEEEPQDGFRSPVDP